MSMQCTFICPPDEFSPLPFWFWNDALEEEEISRQIRDFNAKGICGFIIHPRIGIPGEISYLSDTFMHYVTHAVQEAAVLNMKVVLYDEGMYPSGSAHGMVVAGNPEYATRCLRMIEYPCDDSYEITPDIQEEEHIISAQLVQKLSSNSMNPDNIQMLVIENGKIICPQITQSGEWSILVFIEAFSKGTIRGIHFGEDDGEPAAPPSSDLMNPAATDKFIRVTYERYYEVLHKYFGNTIIAMFTDEPDIMGRCSIPDAKPWTIGFLDFYIEQGGRELDLPMLWFDAGKASETVQRRFKKTVNHRLSDAYYKKISDWCAAHDISLTGHPHESDDIGFLNHFHIPGQDIVWRWVAPEDGTGVEGVHSTMGKCSSDAARHAGRRRNSNECFGCCGPNGMHWAFSADDMKWYLDWLFVRGVNLVYPHAFYYSLRGEKRLGERPPDVGLNNVWWPYYHYMSSYIKRMSWLMTDSHNTTPIAVLCEEDHLPWHITKYLFQNQIEFNYLEYNLLLSEDSCKISDGHILIQNQDYRVLLVENPSLLVSPLFQRIDKFVAGGGELIDCSTLDEMQKALLNVHREVLFSPASPDLRISHVVKEKIDFYLLVNEGENTIQGNFYFRKKGKVELWDPWECTMTKCEQVYTQIHHSAIPITLERRKSIIVLVNSSDSPNLWDSFPAEKNSSVPVQQIACGSFKISTIREFSAVKNPVTILYGRDIELTSWTTWQGMEHFTGTVTYESGFQTDELQPGERVLLDLGEVHEIAHLYINQNNAGVKFWKPYVFDITAFVQTGYNGIRIEITNSLANRLGDTPLPSGLLGPVSLQKL